VSSLNYIREFFASGLYGGVDKDANAKVLDICYSAVCFIHIFIQRGSTAEIKYNKKN